MANALLTKNNAYSTIASWSIGTSNGTFTVATGTGTRFPAISGGDWFFCTLQDASNNIEIVKITAVSTDTFTIPAAGRAQEGTTARTWAIGDIIELRLTAGITVTTDGAQTLTNKTLTSPTLTTPVLGTPSSGTLTNCTGLPVAGGGTGATTLTGVLKGNGTSPITAVATLGVADGGTGAATLTANSVLTGNGTSAVGGVAPGASGNVLTSNGTTWSSTALPTAPVTSVAGFTGAVTAANLNSTLGGASSGLNADLLDGQHASAFQAALGYSPVSKDCGHNNVGSFLWGIYTGSVTPGSTYAGSSIQAGSISQIDTAALSANGSASGTWRALGGSVPGASTGTLFQRIS